MKKHLEIVKTEKHMAKTGKSNENLIIFLKIEKKERKNIEALLFSERYPVAPSCIVIILNLEPKKACFVPRSIEVSV